MSTPTPLTRAEAFAAALVVAPAATVLAAYTLDRFGLSFPPWPMLAVLLASGLATLSLLWKHASTDRASLVTWASTVAATLAWLLWLARPAFLPLGTGPDLTHHLQLIRYIDEHWHLVREAAVEPYLGEMTFYTPGSHILVSLLGAWAGTNGLHALQPLLSLIAALKIGFIVLISRRTLPPSLPRDPLSVVAALTLFASPIFFLGSFLEFAFVAQVVAELYVLFAWFTLTAYAEDGGLRWLMLFGLSTAALFLTWPVLVGPPLLLLGLTLIASTSTPRSIRMVHGIVAATLPLCYGAWFVFGRAAWLQMAGTGGKTAVPAISVYGWPLLIASAAGLLLAIARRRSRVTGFMALAVLTQAGALAALAMRQHNTPYMAQKMFYALLFVQAAGVAALLAAGWSILPRRWHSGVAWLTVAAATVATVRSVATAPRGMDIRVQPAITRPLELAGEWAREHLPPQCVEYLVGDDEAAYWLHLAVLGNPRMSPRTGNFDTYELTPALVRWLTPGGFPYAIADLPAVPRGIRDEFEVMASFDTAAVVRRRGPSSCHTALP